MSKSIKNYAVMFADITGSTALYDTVGDEEAKRKIDICLQLMIRIVEEYQGVVIKTIGDEIMCRYDTVDYAVQAACAIHGIIDTHHELKTPAMSVRIGLHYGSTIEEKNDIFGDTVNVAARIASIAKGRQILTTDNSIEQLNMQLRLLARAYGGLPLKGKRSKVKIWEILWEDDGDETYLAPPITTVVEPKTVLKLVYNQQAFPLASTVPPFSLGRSQEASLFIKTQFVSRVHAFIEYRLGKYILVDNSSNGTHVFFNDGWKSIFLHREEMPLTGDGVISLGEPIVDIKTDPHLINFYFEDT